MGQRCLEVAVRAARAGGKILTERFGTLQRNEIQKKGKYDWVTDVDRTSEQIILRILRSSFPEHSIRAEESGISPSGSAWQWLVDPLDGTVNYMHGFPMFAVSIALAHQGKLEVGVVFDPLRKELFTAQRGKGAWLNGKKIRVTQSRTFEDVLLSTGFPFRAKDQMDLYLASFRRVFRETGSIRRAGSAALDLSYVACGRMDGFWEMALSPWDMAAAALLIREAGGTVTDFFGEDRFLENGHILAGNPAIQKQLLRILQPIFRGKISS